MDRQLAWSGNVCKRYTLQVMHVPPTPTQMLITSSQIQWTSDCEKALDRGDKKGLKSMRKKQVRVPTLLCLTAPTSALRNSSP